MKQDFAHIYPQLEKLQKKIRKGGQWVLSLKKKKKEFSLTLQNVNNWEIKMEEVMK